LHFKQAGKNIAGKAELQKMFGAEPGSREVGKSESPEVRMNYTLL